MLTYLIGAGCLLAFCLLAIVAGIRAWSLTDLRRRHKRAVYVARHSNCAEHRALNGE